MRSWFEVVEVYTRGGVVDDGCADVGRLAACLVNVPVQVHTDPFGVLPEEVGEGQDADAVDCALERASAGRVRHEQVEAWVGAVGVVSETSQGALAGLARPFATDRRDLAKPGDP